MKNKFREAGKKGWTPERRTKQLATYAAKRKAKKSTPGKRREFDMVQSIPLDSLPSRPDPTPRKATAPREKAKVNRFLVVSEMMKLLAKYLEEDR